MSTPLSLISTADIEKALGYVDPMATTVAMRGVLLPTPPDAIQTEFTGFSEHELPRPSRRASSTTRARAAPRRRSVLLARRF